MDTDYTDLLAPIKRLRRYLRIKMVCPDGISVSENIIYYISLIWIKFYKLG